MTVAQSNVESSPVTPKSNSRSPAYESQIRIATTLACSAASSFNKAPTREDSTISSQQRANYIILATEGSTGFAKDLSDAIKLISPSVITVTLPLPCGEEASVSTPRSMPALGHFFNSIVEPKSDAATDAGGMTPKLSSSPVTHLAESPSPSDERQHNSPLDTLPLLKPFEQGGNIGTELKKDPVVVGKTGAGEIDLSPENRCSEGGVVEEQGVALEEGEGTNDMSEASDQEGEEVTQLASNRSTRTVKFNNTVTKTASVSTVDSAAASTRRSDNSLLSRWLSRRSSRTRPVLSRTRSRFPTLHVVAQKDSDQQAKHTTRGRVTVDALPGRTVVNENGEEVEDVEQRMSRPHIATRADSTNERGAKFERRGRPLFRGIGSSFSTSANRRRGRTPAANRTQEAPRFRWMRMMSLSPSSPNSDHHLDNDSEEQSNEVRNSDNPSTSESAVAPKFRLFRRKGKQERSRDTVLPRDDGSEQQEAVGGDTEQGRDSYRLRRKGGDGRRKERKGRKPRALNVNGNASGSGGNGLRDYEAEYDYQSEEDGKCVVS